jgi:penicillin-binding protein 1B
VEIRSGKVTKTSPSSPISLPSTVLGHLGDPETARTPVRLAELSPWLERALLSMEDSRFRSHGGVDPLGILRGLWSGLVGGDLQGGSTITQQLAKNLFLSSERTIRRKVREVFFAAALESQLSKDELLELYLSEIYLGQMGGMPVYGVDAAARAWFGVSASKLDLAQAAAIIGVIPAPNTWSPARNPTGALERRDLVLRKMARDGIVSEEELEQALARPLALSGLPPSRIRRAPYAVDLVVDLAESTLPPGTFAAGGYQLHTAIQPLLQRAAEQALEAGMAEVEAQHPEIVGAQAALVAVRLTDGAVVALVGGRSYTDSPFDRARDAHRQVGSTVKPFTMLAAFDEGLASPATHLLDAPITRDVGGEVWSPRNYDGTYAGDVTVRETIESSRNIPAILLAEQVGLAKLGAFLRLAGLPDATGLPSTALGSFAATPLELAGAYTVFDRGVSSRPRVLLDIVAPGGETVHRFPPDQVKVASAEAAAVAVHVLEGVLESGTGARAAAYGVRPPVAGKSGTTDNYRDAWFVGLTREYAIAVWVGRDEGLLGLSGSKAALPSWARFVAATAGSTAPRLRPGGVTAATVCGETGQLARGACPLRYEEWLVSADLPVSCEEHDEFVFRPGEFFDRLFRPKKRELEERPPSRKPRRH